MPSWLTAACRPSPALQPLSCPLNAQTFKSSDHVDNIHDITRHCPSRHSSLQPPKEQGCCGQGESWEPLESPKVLGRPQNDDNGLQKGRNPKHPAWPDPKVTAALDYTRCRIPYRHAPTDLSALRPGQKVRPKSTLHTSETRTLPAHHR